MRRCAVSNTTLRALRIIANLAGGEAAAPTTRAEALSYRHRVSHS
jgi:hypothetical protein